MFNTMSVKLGNREAIIQISRLPYVSVRGRSCGKAVTEDGGEGSRPALSNTSIVRAKDLVFLRSHVLKSKQVINFI